MLVPLNIPPGVYTNGTEYQSKGRNFDANLVRWQFGALGPMGGWRQRTTTTVSGKARRVISWRDNNNQVWAAIGTNSNLYAMTVGGAVTDITPTGLTAGRQMQIQVLVMVQDYMDKGRMELVTLL